MSRAGDRQRLRIADDPTTEYAVLATRGSEGAFSGLIARYTRDSDQVRSQHFGERFFYVRSGEGVLEIGGERYAVGPGSCVHYSSHHEHTLTVTTDDPLETVWLVDPPII